MNTSKTFLLFALAAGTFFIGCKGTGSKKELLYNNYTGTDTDAFNFLKEGYHQARYQQFAAKNMTNTALAADISKTCADIAQQLIAIGTYDKVIIPPLNETTFEKLAQSSDTLSVIENFVVDSLATVETSISPETEISSIEKIIGSQEKLIHQFQNASENTNVKIRHYAQETLPQLEDLLARTKSENH